MNVTTSGRPDAPLVIDEQLGHGLPSRSHGSTGARTKGPVWPVGDVPSKAVSPFLGPHGQLQPSRDRGVILLPLSPFPFGAQPGSGATRSCLSRRGDGARSLSEVPSSERARNGRVTSYGSYSAGCCRIQCPQRLPLPILAYATADDEEDLSFALSSPRSPCRRQGLLMSPVPHVWQHHRHFSACSQQLIDG